MRNPLISLQRQSLPEGVRFNGLLNRWGVPPISRAACDDPRGVNSAADLAAGHHRIEITAPTPGADFNFSDENFWGEVGPIGFWARVLIGAVLIVMTALLFVSGFGLDAEIGR